MTPHPGDMIGTRWRENRILLAACRLDSISNGGLAGGGEVAHTPVGNGTPRLDGAGWTRLIERAKALGVAPQLHVWATRRARVSEVPEEALSSLRTAYYSQAARNAELHAELADLLIAFDRKGIPAILLKGIALAQPVYRNIALRPMADIDVLVRRSDLEVAGEVARTLGYGWSEWYQTRAWYLANHHHLAPLEGNEGRTIVELHWNITPPAAGLLVDPRSLWSRARTERINGREALVLAPDDLLLHLALHVAGTAAFVAGLSALRDIALVTHRYADDFDWARFCMSAKSCGGARHCYYALSLAQSALRANLSTDALRDLRSVAVTGPLEERHIQWFGTWAMLRDRSESGSLPSELVQGWSQGLLQDQSWVRRLRTSSASVYRGWREVGRRKGLGRWAGLYGLMVHPWITCFFGVKRALGGARGGADRSGESP